MFLKNSQFCQLNFEKKNLIAVHVSRAANVRRPAAEGAGAMQSKPHMHVGAICRVVRCACARMHAVHNFGSLPLSADIFFV